MDQGRVDIAETAVTIRFASGADRDALERLAALDSGSVPVGAVLIAEVDGELRAALPLRGTRALADPFRPTAGLVRLLKLREAQLRGVDRRGRRQRGPHRAGRRQSKPARAA